jgi:dephospho-CoA kinase
VIGILGLPASGKSTVAAMLADLGAQVIDADAAVTHAYRDPAVRARIAAALGADCFDERGEPRRRHIAGVVFADAAKRRLLEEILHPEVRACIHEELKAAASAEPPRTAVLDVPLLAEGGLADLCDAFLFVEASDATRVQRARARGWDEAELSARDAAQLSAEAKCAVAGSRPLESIANDGDLEATRAALLGAWRRLTRNSP